MQVLSTSLAFLACLCIALGSPIPEIPDMDSMDYTSGDIQIKAVDINKQKFLLYTRSNQDKPVELKNDNLILLLASPYSNKRPTKVLIHGWQNNYESESMQIIKEAYLTVSDVNVLICDYEEYNSPYLSAVTNAKKIGQNIAKFLQFLQKHGQKAEDFHILGHSLGAHISGFVANNLDFRISRLTGLDAAGPLFNNKGKDGRLSEDDADLVECLHTSKEFGMTNRCGAIDFYPHGGTHQPICDHAQLSSGCDHSASYRYYEQSIIKRSLYPSFKCETVEEAQDVEKAVSSCKPSAALMGEDSITTATPGIYYVQV